MPLINYENSLIQRINCEGTYELSLIGLEDDIDLRKNCDLYLGE